MKYGILKIQNMETNQCIGEFSEGTFLFFCVLVFLGLLFQNNFLFKKKDAFVRLMLTRKQK